MASPTLEIHNTSISRSTRPLLELAVGYGLILATIWTPRPYQAWLWWTSAVWIALTTMRAFPGWEAMGFRRGGEYDPEGGKKAAAAEAHGGPAGKRQHSCDGDPGG